MSVGIVLPKTLIELSNRLSVRLEDPVHVSQNFKTVRSMTTKMEKPRRVFTFLPSHVENSNSVIESLSKEMGPLDVVIDCYMGTKDDVFRRCKMCEENSTQYLLAIMTRDTLVVHGGRTAYMENKNLLRKIKKHTYYAGPINIV